MLTEIGNTEKSKEVDDKLNTLIEEHNELFGRFLDLNTDSYVAGFSEGWDACYDEVAEVVEVLKNEMCIKCRTAKLDDCCKCEWVDREDEIEVEL